MSAAAGSTVTTAMPVSSGTAAMACNTSSNIARANSRRTCAGRKPARRCFAQAVSFTGITAQMSRLVFMRQCPVSDVRIISLLAFGSQDDLAGHRTLLQKPVRLRCLRERQPQPDTRTDAAGGQELNETSRHVAACNGMMIVGVHVEATDRRAARRHQPHFAEDVLLRHRSVNI